LIGFALARESALRRDAHLLAGDQSRSAIDEAGSAIGPPGSEARLLSLAAQLEQLG
jgi:hypothetical protein